MIKLEGVGTVAYAAAPITIRLIALAARPIVNDIGTYHAVRHSLSFILTQPLIRIILTLQLWRCDELIHLVNSVSVVSSDYPLCTQVGVDPSTVYVAVLAKTGAGDLHFASVVRVVFGMALWIGILIHALGIEVYVSVICFRGLGS